MAIDPKTLKEKLPTDLGKLIDMAYRQRDARLKMEREAAELKASEDEMKAEIAARLRSGKLESAKGKEGVASFRRSVVANIVDEEAFLAWARKPANRDVLKVGVVLEAWRARRGDGIAVPGTEPFAKEDLTLSKAGA